MQALIPSKGHLRIYISPVDFQENGFKRGGYLRSTNTRVISAEPVPERHISERRTTGGMKLVSRKREESRRKYTSARRCRVGKKQTETPARDAHGRFVCTLAEKRFWEYTSLFPRVTFDMGTFRGPYGSHQTSEFQWYRVLLLSRDMAEQYRLMYDVLDLELHTQRWIRRSEKCGVVRADEQEELAVQWRFLGDTISAADDAEEWKIV